MSIPRTFPFSITSSPTTFNVSIGSGTIRGDASPVVGSPATLAYPGGTLALPPNTTGSIFLYAQNASSNTTVDFTDDQSLASLAIYTRGTTSSTLPQNCIELARYQTGPVGVVSMTLKDVSNDFYAHFGVGVVQTLTQLADLDTGHKAAIVTGSNSWPANGDGADGAGLYFLALPDSIHPAGDGVQSTKAPGSYWFKTRTAVDAASMAALSNFRFTSAGLTLTVAPGKLIDASGADLVFAGGQTTLAASVTSYVFLSLKDLSLVLSTQSICRGMVLLGKVVTSGSAVTSKWQPPRFEIPKTRIPNTLAKLNSGSPLKVLVAGDSILAGAGPLTAAAQPIPQLFSASSASYGNNVANVANVSFANRSLGGASAIHGLALAARLCTPMSTLINSMADANNLRPYINCISSSPKTTSLGNGAIRGSLPDLVIVEYGTNLPPTGTSQSTKQITAHHIEAQINQWRDAGAEVLLIRPYAGNDGGQASRTYSADGDLVARIARDTGAELADWHGVMAYNLLLGNAVYSGDNVHPSDLGATVIATAMRGVLHTVAVDAEPRVAKAAQQRYGSYAYSYVAGCAAEFQCGYTAGTGTSGATSNAQANLAVVLNGTSPSLATYQLALNQTMMFSHGACTEVWIQHELPSGATATLQFRDAGGTDIVAPISLTGTANIQWTRLMGYADFAAAVSAGRFLNGYPFSFQCGGTLKVTALSGATALPIAGILFVTHETEDIPFETVRFAGTWGTESARDQGANISYTDTANSSFSFCYNGDYAIVSFEVGSQAGFVDAYCDGELIYSNQNLNIFGAGTYTYQMKICPKGNLPPVAPVSTARGQHSVRVVLRTAGGAPAAQNRSMAPVRIVSLKAK